MCAEVPLPAASDPAGDLGVADLGPGLVFHRRGVGARAGPRVGLPHCPRPPGHHQLFQLPPPAFALLQGNTQKH